MSEIDPDKILAELEAARLARQQNGGSFPVRHRGLLVATAVAITLLLLALFALWLVLGRGVPNRAPESPDTGRAAAASGATSHLRNRFQLPKVVNNTVGNAPEPPAFRP